MQENMGSSQNQLQQRKRKFDEAIINANVMPLAVPLGHCLGDQSEHICSCNPTWAQPNLSHENQSPLNILLEAALEQASSISNRDNSIPSLAGSETVRAKDLGERNSAVEGLKKVVFNSEMTIQDPVVNGIILDPLVDVPSSESRPGSCVSNSVLQLMRSISTESSNLPVILEHMVTILCLKENRALSDKQVLTVGKLIAYGLDKNLSKWSKMEVDRMHKAIQGLAMWICGLQRLEDDPADHNEILAEQFLRAVGSLSSTSPLVLSAVIQVMRLVIQRVYEWKIEPERSETNRYEVLPRAKQYSMFAWSNILLVENSYYLCSLVEYLIGIPIWAAEDSNVPIPSLLDPPTNFMSNWTDIFQKTRLDVLWESLPLFCAYIWRITDQMKIEEQNKLLLSFVKSEINGEFQNNLNNMTL